ncbi:MAG: M23 family metallopeptidase [Patescibacteria group bacterium]
MLKGVIFDTIESISTQWFQNLLLKKKTVSAVVFLLGASLFNLLFFGNIKQTRASNYSLGGPAESDTSVSIHNSFSFDESDYSESVMFSDGSLLSHGNSIDSYAEESGLIDLKDYFSIPTTGWNWGQLHRYNAVDIANSCGKPIYAAAEGLVKEARDGWSEGYGTYVLINHANNTSTKYAHNQKNLVNAGQYVLRGDLIAYIGNTGNVHGETGCHLHFEVRGAKNPFVKK